MRAPMLVVSTLLAMGSLATFAQAQVVQLPSFQQTTINTSVLVPDRGSMVIGGMGGSASQSRVNGNNVLFPQRAFGVGTSASGMQVQVQIHDFAEMDAAVLATARRNALQKASILPGDVRVAPNVPLPGSVADEIRQRETAVADAQQEARRHYDEGQEAEKIGKPNVARIYYRMAEKQATGELRTAVLARLNAIDGAKATAQPSAKSSR